MKRRLSNVPALTTAIVALSAILALPVPAAADDRDLFRSAADSPYLFILFDATGSMEWILTAETTPARIDDDPSSRLFLAKQALDGVLQGTGGVHFGFATFPNHTGLRVRRIAATTGGFYVSEDLESESRWCEGIELNSDSSSDLYDNYTFKWPTGATTSGLSTGDLIPLDWAEDNLDRIRDRLAPNLALGETVPDYGIARYFEDPACRGCSDPPNGSYFRLRDSAARPFLARGATPLGEALIDFKAWHDAWRPLAEAQDPALASGCREVSVVLMTDGFDTCNNTDPVAAAQTLARAGITVYVIGFAVNNPALEDIAREGGSPERDLDGDDVPDGVYSYTATNQQDLIDAFNAIIDDVQERSRTFATAAVPSVVGSAAENVYLTQFSPTADGTSLWPGRLDGYIKPVPLVDVGGQVVADRRKTCLGADPDNCLAWDGAKELLVQAPTRAELDAGTFKLGNGNGLRRVFYGEPVAGRAVETRRIFRTKSPGQVQDELYGPQGFGLTLGDPNFQADGEEIVKYFLQEKQADILNPITRAQETVDYVMADIFHSDPTVIAEPRRFDYFAKDLEGQTEPCGASNDDPSRYPCFVRDQLSRRRVVLVGSNEGALHAFDAGAASRNTDGIVEYSVGSGRELFAYVPRSVMPKIREMAAGSGHQFTVDGPVTVDDVLIDPSFTTNDPLDPADREWRTVAVGGLREGGKAYYALDVTRPDPIDPNQGVPSNPSLLYPGCSGTNATAPGGNPETNCRGRYPEIKWEWTHTWDEDPPGTPGHGAADLAFTWSQANTGRVRIKTGVVNGEVVTEDRYVAIFGGGMDPEFKQNPVGTEVEGNYLFMVDIETGQLLYKRSLDAIDASGTRVPASAPSQPAAVDTDQDSYLDTIYIGNTAGYLYKVDISEPVEIVANVPIRDYSEVDPSTGSPPLTRRVDRIVDAAWDPFPIFRTGGRPIYFPPSVIFVPEQARYAVAFGTGDREDLWSDDLLGGRFYMILDDGFGEVGNVAALPLDESDFESFDAGRNRNVDPNRDLIENPDTTRGFRAGWVLELDLKERVAAKSFGLSGVVFFSTYLPVTTTGSGTAVCSSSGDSRLYSVFADNGGGLSSNGARFRQVSDFVTQPFVESAGAAKGKPTDPSQPPEDQTACSDDELQALRNSLMADMPAECDFAQYSLNVMTLQSENGVQCIVPVPVCVIDRNWKEF